MLRGAVLGCGFIAEYHLRAWAQVPGVEIVALADRRREVAEARRALAPAARVYDDLGALLAAERPDFVDVLTPPDAHAAHCRAAAAAGAHVICQKPLAPDDAEAEAVIADVARRGRQFAVHENHRFRPWFAALCQRVRAGAVGTPRFLRLEQWDAREPAEAYKTTSPRAVLLEYGTHLVDMMRALLGEPTAVWARGHHPNPRVRGESLAHAAFTYDGATAVVDVAWKASGEPRAGLLLVGDEGEAHYDGTFTRGARATLRLCRGDEVLLDEARVPTDDYVASFVAFQRAFAAALRGEGPLPQPAADNLRTLRATMAAYRSIAAAEPVRLPGG